MLMIENRRRFLAAFAALPFIGFARAEEEPFPVPKDDAKKIYWKFRKREVDYQTTEEPGTVIIDTPNKFLYLVLGGGRAMRYGVGIGKDGFRWSGTAFVRRKAKWPKWTPTKEQLERRPDWRKWAAGFPPGPFNPLGSRAIYLFDEKGNDTLYRIHGTNEPTTIGKKVSSGCLRMINAEIIDLYERVPMGAKVIVL
jgi:lipoprotein-anchoring transpeptidase ErfK/SrfK